MKLIFQLKQEAEKLGVTVEEVNKGVELLAPEGMCFDEGLHGLVNTQWDHEPMPNVYRRALKDLREVKLKPCSDDCECHG